MTDNTWSETHLSHLLSMKEEKHLLKCIVGTNPIATWMFTVRADYEKHFLEHGIVQCSGDVWTNAALVKAIQRHWHCQGQNGCRFAQHIALKADTMGWEQEVVFGIPDVLSHPTPLAMIEKCLQAAISREENQVLSFLFPHVTTSDEFVNFINVMQQLPSISTVRDETIGCFNAIALRIGLAEGTVESWVMGFGPFSFLPQTRRAPITEIVVRTKVKPNTLFYRLNQDRAAAHLADTPPGMNEDAMERRWQGTARNTRAVLGREPDALSAAKVTFVVPTAFWLRQ